jgi:hypothetical protein
MPNIYSNQGLVRWDNATTLLVFQVWPSGTGMMNLDCITLAFTDSLAVISLIITQIFTRYSPHLQKLSLVFRHPRGVRIRALQAPVTFPRSILIIFGLSTLNSFPHKLSFTMRCGGGDYS